MLFSLQFVDAYYTLKEVTIETIFFLFIEMRMSDMTVFFVFSYKGCKDTIALNYC